MPDNILETKDTTDEQFKNQINSQFAVNDFNVDDLVFKTMPKDNGTGGPFIKPKPASTSFIPAPIKPLSSSIPAPLPPPIPSSKPIPSMPTTIPPMPSVPLTAITPKAPTSTEHTEAHHDLATDFGMELHETKPTRTRNLILILIILLALGGGAYFAFAKGWVHNPFAKKAAQTGADKLPGTVTSDIPDSWRIKYFSSADCDQNLCGDQADPDKDGLLNIDEYKSQTDPNSADSDGDKVSDGDEKNIFGFDPITAHTSGNLLFDDGKDAKDKWNSTEKRKFTPEELQAIAAKAKQFGFHEPTISLLGADTISSYINYVIPGESTQTPTTEAPKEGALDRDTQRFNTINKISFALLKYKETNKSYPNVQNFADMISMIRPLISAQAINTTDPINTEPYTYKYKAVSGGANFQLSYYSETTNQLILITEASAQKAYASDQSVQRDTKRKTDLEQISNALELYSNDHIDGTDPDAQIFPDIATWKSALEEKYITKVPVDPKTNNDYVYTVSSDNSSFALQATLENPPTNKRGYLCTPDGCDFY